MKKPIGWMLFGLLAPLALGAQQAETLELNAAPTVVSWQEAEVTLAKTIAGANETAVLDAVITVSRPTETLAAPSAEDKLTLAVDADGAVKVSNGTAWVATGATVPESGEVALPVKIVAATDATGLHFKVRVGTASEVSVAATDATPGISKLLFDGEGSVTGVAVAAVEAAIVPPAAEGASQDPALVSKYAKWAQEATKGGAMAEASESDKADAFAMNAGGKPSLTITAIEPQADASVKIVVRGSYQSGTATAEVPLGDIYGTLYVTYAATLSASPVTETFPLVLNADGKTATITLPAEKQACFLKARVALSEPDNTL